MSAARAWAFLSIIAYTAAGAAWVFLVYDRDPEPAGSVWLAVLALLAAAHVAGGAALGPPALALPLVLLAPAAAAGARDGDADGFPVLGAALLHWLLPALALIGLGIGARGALRRRRGTPGSTPRTPGSR